MKKSLQMIIVLVVVGIVSGTALVYMYKYAQPLIEENKKKAVQEAVFRSEEHTSELQSHSFISYAVFCLKKKK